MMLKLTIIALAAGLTAACSVLDQVPPRGLVVLSEPNPPVAAAPRAGGQAVLVRVPPVRVPEYLDSYDVLVRSAPHRLAVQPDVKWAEKLPAALTRMLRERIAAAGFTEVDRAEEINILVQIDRFEPTTSGEVVLSARWQIVRSGPGSVLRSGAASIVHPAGGATAAQVDAMAAAAAELSRRIVDDLGASAG